MAGDCLPTAMRILLAGVREEREGDRSEDISERMVSAWASWPWGRKGRWMSIIL